MFGGGGVAIGGIVVDRTLEETKIDFGLARRFDETLKAVHRHFLHQPRRLAATGLADNGAADGVLGRRRHAGRLEGETVGNQHMARGMQQQ